MDLLLPRGRLRQGCGVLACAYYLRRRSRRLSILYCYFHGMVLCGIVDEEILAALGHLPEYPTCSKAVCWHGIRCTVNFAWPIEPSLQYSSTPCFGFFVIGSGDLQECTLFVRTRGLVRAGGSQNFDWVFQALSIMQYFCTMVAKSSKCAMSR